jgi:hypothetical protein
MPAHAVPDAADADPADGFLHRSLPLAMGPAPWRPSLG